MINSLRKLFFACCVLISPLVGCGDSTQKATDLGKVALPVESGAICNSSVCCPASCGQCGGQGCGRLSGGANECCTSRILESAVYCDEANSPCIIGGDPNADPPPKVSFETEALCNARVCCPASCGSCGGKGCGQLPGGARECCSGAIEKSDVYCDAEPEANVPCIRGGDPSDGGAGDATPFSDSSIDRPSGSGPVVVAQVSDCKSRTIHSSM